MFEWMKKGRQAPTAIPVLRTVSGTVVPPDCPYCGNAAKLAKGNDIYPHRQDLRGHNFWQCAPCDAYVGCHKPGTHHHNEVTGERVVHTGFEPLGRLADAELRRAKQQAHAAFDPLWQSRGMSRTKAYTWLAGALGVPVSQCHIGMFDVAQCRRVVELVSDRVFGRGA